MRRKVKYSKSKIVTDDAFIALSKDFSVMTTFQSVGLVDGERVPLVRTLVNSSFTTVRTG
jgi:hypothetical protein